MCKEYLLNLDSRLTDCYQLFRTKTSKNFTHRKQEYRVVYLSATDFSINQKYNNHSKVIKDLKDEVLKEVGKVILIYWHHGTILKLVNAFGFHESEFPFSKWPGTVFDLIFSITWDSGQPILQVDNEQLLYGDTTATGKRSRIFDD